MLYCDSHTTWNFWQKSFYAGIILLGHSDIESEIWQKNYINFKTNGRFIAKYVYLKREMSVPYENVDL